MKLLAVIYGLIFIYCLSGAQTIRLDSVALVSQPDQHLSKPKWSPDGKFILATGDYNSGLYLINPQFGKNQKLSDVPGAGTNAFWLGNEKIGYIRRNKMETIDLPGMKSTLKEDTVIMLNARENRIEMMDIRSGERKIITKTKGYFYHPVLSPDKTRAVVHLGSEMYVYNTDGSGEYMKIGTGLASCWTPDSKYIVYFFDQTADGHSISNSELYIVDALGKNRQQLTNTEELWEMWPDISPDGSKITFADSKSSRIYIATIRTEIK